MMEFVGLVLGLVGLALAFRTPNRWVGATFDRGVALLFRTAGSGSLNLIGDPNESRILGHSLKNVRFFRSPPIDIRAAESAGRVTCRRDNLRFRLGLPANWQALVEEVIQAQEVVRHVGPSSAASARKRLHERVEAGRFALIDEVPFGPESPSSQTIRSLLDNGGLIEECRKAEFLDYVSGSAGFLFNGELLSVSSFKSLRTADEHPEIEIVLSTTDYFTYRIVSRLSPHIQASSALRCHGNNLSEYFGAGFQKGVHAALGLALIIHSLRDGRAIVTRRSSHAANNAGEAGKYFMSANEAVNPVDVSDGGHSIDLYGVVERALKEELIGTEPQDAVRSLLARVETCLFVGAFLYLPNMSIGPCFYVAIDCDSDEIRARHSFARDGTLETSGIIRENRWDEATGLPRFEMTSIRRFIEETIGAGPAHETWDEGALCALALATHGAQAAGLSSISPRS